MRSVAVLSVLCCSLALVACGDNPHLRFELREADAGAPDAAGDAAVSDGGASDGDVQADASTFEDSAVIVADADLADSATPDATLADATTPDAAVTVDAAADAGPVDIDDDGYTSDVDCDDNDDTVNPGAMEICDGKDNDCNDVIDDVLRAPAASNQNGVCAGAVQVCAEGGGFEDPDYTTIDGYEAVETSCDGLDNDCDRETDEGLLVALYTDGDGDGFGSGAYDYCNDPRTSLGCAGREGYADVAGDCNDRDERSAPGIAETCDGVDNDCDGLVDEESTGCGPTEQCMLGACAPCVTTIPTIVAEDTAICANVGTISVTSSIGVVPGATLVIGAGNRLEFADGTRLYIRNLGGLVVHGTSANPTVFTSASLTPTRTSWEGLVGEASITDLIQLNGVIVEYARNGTGYGARISDSVVRECAVALTYAATARNSFFEDNDVVSSGGMNKFGFSRFSGNGRVFRDFAYPTVADSEIDDNDQVGVEYTYSRICRSFVHDNASLAGTVGSTHGYVFTDSTIVDNGTGFVVAGNTTSASNSVICRNGSDYAVRMRTPNDAEFRNNYWCTTDSTEVGSGFYDLNDDITLGRVFYTPILMSAPADAPGTW